MLDDVLKPGLRLVICGTAAGDRSAKLRQYYAGRGNKFWRLLFELRLTSRQLPPEEFRSLLEFGIGLTDIVKGQSGIDARISFSPSGSAELREKVLKFQPQVLCFNGKRAAKEFVQTVAVAFGWQQECIGRTRVFVAPSTSGAAGASWDLSVWEELAQRIRNSPGVGQ